MIDIKTLRAAGLTDTQIVKVIEEDQAKQREYERIRKRDQRARPRDDRDSRDTSLSLVSKKDLLSKERKGVRGKPIAIPLPVDWQPKGPQRDPTEADEFRDMCRSKARTYVDFDAAYRNFQRSPYNARNKSGAPQPALDEANRVAMLEEFHRAQLNGRNGNGQGRGKETTAEKPRTDNDPELRPDGAVVREIKTVARQLAFPQSRRR